MKTLIYQFWTGQLTSGNEAGVILMDEYAQRIGSEYQFELNPVWPKDARIKPEGLGRYTPHYGAFKFIFEPVYDDYDFILFCDTDVVPVDHTHENIFEEFAETNAEIGICEEWMQPELREKHNMGGINNRNDNIYYGLCERKYGTKMLRDSQGRPRVFNSGCVVYSKAGRKKAREVFESFKEYVDYVGNHLPSFYQGDQNYLNAMLPKFDWTIMDYKWNSQIFFTPGTTGDNRPISDYREQPNFVHVQLRGADHYDMKTLRKVVNE
jgi:hypothetical protein